MTIAEIHGKISSGGGNLSDRLEDLLTSDVFGPLRYLPFTEGLLRVIGKARLYTDPGTTFYAKFGKNLHNEPNVVFWPRMGRSEPDVLIEFDDHLVMVEAKYLSGKSGDFDPESIETVSHDQLAREFRDLLDNPGVFSNRTLIYLTAHSTLPKEDLVKSHGALNGEESEEKFHQNAYWLSWYEIRNAVEELLCEQKDQNKKLVLRDIERLLHRKGFRKFEGFEKVVLDTVCSPPKTIFYQIPLGKFRGFDKLMVNSNPLPENAFYLRSNRFLTLTQGPTMSTDERSMAVINTFGNVAKIYEETSFLLKDFSDEMKRLGFVRLRSDSGIGTDTSRDIRMPKKWHVRYASLSFKPEGQDSNEPYACITAIFCDYEGEPVPPYLIAGFVKMEWHYWNFYNAYLDAKETFDDNDGKLIRLDRGDGHAIAQPLLQVGNTEDVKELAQKIVEHWKEKVGNSES